VVHLRSWMACLEQGLLGGGCSTQVVVSAEAVARVGA
jgi:hypothetical protein